jgi:hypothetical protein
MAGAAEVDTRKIWLVSRHVWCCEGDSGLGSSTPHARTQDAARTTNDVQAALSLCCSLCSCRCCLYRGLSSGCAEGVAVNMMTSRHDRRASQRSAADVLAQLQPCSRSVSRGRAVGVSALVGLLHDVTWISDVLHQDEEQGTQARVVTVLP